MSFDFKPQNSIQREFTPPKVPVLGSFSVWMFLGGGLLIAAIFLGGPLVHGFKDWRARSHAEDAAAALKMEKYGSAISSLHDARDWSPEEPAVLRVIIDYLLLAEGDPREIAHTIRLLGTKQPLPPELQLAYADALLACGRTEEARQVHAALATQHAATKEAVTLKSKILAAEGKTTQAQVMGRQANQLDKDSPEGRVALAVENRRHHFPELSQGAWDDLQDLSQRPDQVGIDAILAISRDSRIDLALARKLLGNIGRHPHATLLNRLAVTDSLIRLQPDLRDSIIQSEVDRFQSAQGATNGGLVEFSAWLSTQREHERLLKLIPAHLVADSRPLYTCIIKALVGQGRWKEMKDLLKSRRPPVTNTLATIWMADAESHLQPDLAESRRLLGYAVDAASKSGEHEELELAGGLSHKLGFLDFGIKAYRRLAEVLEPRRVEFLLRTRVIALQAQDTRQVLETSRLLLSLQPSNASYADQLSYYRLLLGEEMEAVDFASLAQLANDDGSNIRLPVALLEALIAYRMGDRTALLSEIGRVTSTDMPPGPRAVLSGLLATAGETAKAFQLAEKIPAAGLLPEERLFLKLAQ